MSSGQQQRLAVFPTRMSLNNIKVRQKGAEKGHSLLKRKSDALTVRFRSILSRIHEAKLQMGQLMKAGAFALAELDFSGASESIGEDSLGYQIREAVKGPAKVKVRSVVENVSGVQLPAFEIFRDDSTGITSPTAQGNGHFMSTELTGLARGGQQYQKCRDIFSKALDSLVQLASLQTAFFVLDDVIKTTNRRVNALEYVVLPRLENTINYIGAELDEQDREEFFRLKKIQSKKRREKDEVEEAEKLQALQQRLEAYHLPVQTGSNMLEVGYDPDIGSARIQEMELPSIGLGMYRMPSEDVKASVDAALKAGYRHFDTAAVYRNEAALGAALRELLPVYCLDRSQVFVTSKLAPADHGYEECRVAVQRSWEALGLGMIDLYLVHWPGKAKLPPGSPEHAQYRRETWRALEACVGAGLVRHIGVSNYAEKHLEEMKGYAKIFPYVNQVELHPLHLPSARFFELCDELNIRIQAYSSLAQGKLVTDRFINDHPEYRLMIESRLKEGATGSTAAVAAQICLSWARLRGWSVIPKTVHPDRIQSNFVLLELSDQEMAYLDRLYLEDSEAGKVCWDPSQVA